MSDFFHHVVQLSLELAQKAANQDEIPVGAIVFQPESQIILAQASNLVETQQSPLAHAEILALTQALTKTKDKYLTDYDMYVTLEPCPMCAAAISLCRIRRLYYGAYDPKSGGIDQGPRIFNHPTCHHKPEVYSGIGEQQAGKLLKDFFTTKRD